MFLFDLGTNSYTCWAYSCASMLRASCIILIQSYYRFEPFRSAERKRCENFISEDAVHVEIRNLIMMTLVPRKLHSDDKSQGSYIRAAVSRVRQICTAIHMPILDC